MECKPQDRGKNRHERVVGHLASEKAADDLRRFTATAMAKAGHAGRHGRLNQGVHDDGAKPMLDLTLIAAALRAGRRALASTLAAERHLARPESPLARVFVERAAALQAAA